MLVSAPSLHGDISGRLYAIGTSNAAAITSRHAHEILDILETTISPSDAPPLPDVEYHPVLAKTLLVHATLWPANTQKLEDQLDIQRSERRRSLTEHFGFGILDTSRIRSITQSRATLIGAGSITKDERHCFQFPLPLSLSGSVEWRRLVLTLSWISPVQAHTQKYRIAHLKFDAPRDVFDIDRTQAFHYMNGRGTVQHEILEGGKAVVYSQNQTLQINVDCRVRVGRLDNPVRFGLAATLEVGANAGIDIYQEIRDKLRTPVRVPAQSR